MLGQIVSPACDCKVRFCWRKDEDSDRGYIMHDERLDLAQARDGGGHLMIGRGVRRMMLVGMMIVL